MHADIGAKKLGVGELFKTGWWIFQLRKIDILFIFLLLVLPTWSLSLVHVEKIVPPGAYWLLSPLLALVSLLIALPAKIALAKLVDDTIKGEKSGWREAIRFAISRWGVVTGTSLMLGGILIGLSLLLILPGVIFGIYFIFAIYVAALKPEGGGAALDRSKALVTGQWQRVFGVSLLLGFLSILPVIVYYPIERFLQQPLIHIITWPVFSLVDIFFRILFILFYLNTEECFERGAAEKQASKLIDKDEIRTAYEQESTR